MQTMTRKEAARLGLKKYNTTKPCIRGHHSARYVNTGACSSCIAVYSREYRERLGHDSTHVKIWLRSKKDEKKVLKFVDALNFDRELKEISEGIM